jgi:sugar lactone lactonase YvrE
VLVTILLLLVLLSVTAITLNSRAGLQVQMSFNQTWAIQTYLGQKAALEQALWQLSQSPGWRTGSDVYTYQGISYTRSVTNSSVAGYTDSITLSATAPYGIKPLRASFRYYTDTPAPFVNNKMPYKVAADGASNLYFADQYNHSVWRINGASGAVTRVAGNGTSGFSGDGGQAVLAQLNAPQGVCIDQAGNIYIADTGNNRVRKLTLLTNTLATIAGTGVSGASGDNGPAASAQLNAPGNVSVDGQGNIYIADTGNHRIRRVDASTGVITTVAGTGAANYSGDGGPAFGASLNSPSDVFVDGAGNIFIADTLNHVIRKIDTAGVIHLVAGTPQSGGYSGDGGTATSAQLNQPNGVCADQAGNVYIADTNNSRIRMVGSSAMISTFAGDGSAAYQDGPVWYASFDHPMGVCVPKTGAVVVADTMNCTLRSVASWTVSTVTITPALGLSSPGEVAAYYNSSRQTVYLYIADTKNNRIRQFDTSANTVTTVAGNGSQGFWGDGGAATSAVLNQPMGVGVDGQGNLYIADTNNNRIRMVNASSGLITTVAGTGAANYSGDGGPAFGASLNSPSDVFVDGAGNIFIADTLNHVIRKIDTAGVIHLVAGTPQSGGYSGDGGTATSAQLNQPNGVCADQAGNVYIADTLNNRVREVNSTNTITTVAGPASLSNPTDVVVDGSGSIFVTDTNNNVIRLVSNGVMITLAGTPPTGGFNGDNMPAVNVQINGPTGVALAGNRGGGKIYIADTGNDRIRVLALKKVIQLY